jgi:hypothetical protein
MKLKIFNSFNVKLKILNSLKYETQDSWFILNETQDFLVHLKIKLKILN